MLFLASLVFTGGNILIFFSQTFWTFVAGRVVVGIGAGAIAVVVVILLLELTDHKRRGIWIGLYNSSFTIGVSLGGILGGVAINSKLGWVRQYLMSRSCRDYTNWN